MSVGLESAVCSPPPQRGELLEGDERAENPQELESFGERWFRLYGSATKNDNEEIGFPSFESRVGSVSENVTGEVRFPGYVGAVPGSVGGGDSERVPSLLPPHGLQSCGILVVMENEGPVEAQYQGGGDTDLEVSPPIMTQPS